MRDRVKLQPHLVDDYNVNPITHFLVGWAVGSGARLEQRDRAVVALAGLAPDLDGLGIVADFATAGSENPTEWWGTYHHLLGHNLGAALGVTVLAYFVAKGRYVTASLAFASFHLHLLSDVIGSRGPDGYQWPIPYLLPFSNSWQLVWSGQWGLNAWPNFALTAGLLAFAFFLAWRRGYSPLELISLSADRAFVTALRGRFGVPNAARETAD